MINSILRRATKGQPTPEIGMGATLLHYTDRSPGTIVFIEKNVIGVQGDNAQRVDDNGMSEMQTYTYTPNPEAGTCYFRFDEAKGWRAVRRSPETGRWVLNGTQGLRIGARNKYHDYSF